jgi:NAD(P)-dependent dehydrogenase (short-subunit alcohol dehydrogenase family)
MAARYAEIHNSPNGPGDARPTALQIIQDEGLEGKLDGKVILITGCSSGIGVETAKALFTTGATLYLTARDLSKAQSALGDIVTSPRVHLLELDLNSLASVRACAEKFLSMSKTLNIFIANAGVMATPEGRTKDGFETQFGTNHLAHFLLFNLLKPTLLASSTPQSSSRAVIVASMSHRNGSGVMNFSNLNLEGCYDAWVAYSQSKLANVWTANEIDRRYGAQGLHAWSLQPGGVISGLAQHMSADMQQGFLGDEVLRKGLKSAEQGAATSIWGAVAGALEGMGGKYLEDCQIAGQWGPWKGDGMWEPGYGAMAYDEEGEAKLWKESLKLVGLKDDL